MTTLLRLGLCIQKLHRRFPKPVHAEPVEALPFSLRPRTQTRRKGRSFDKLRISGFGASAVGINHAVLVLLALVFWGMAATARADELRPGYLELTQRTSQDWHLVWKAPVLGGLATRARPAFPPFCTLTLDAAQLRGAAVVAQGELYCTKSLDGTEVGLSGIEGSFTDALLRIQPLGRPIQAERLTQDRPTATVLTVPDRWQVARTYLLLGIEHILTGYDHLLFVVSLVLLLMRGWVVVRAATAFTVAHSLTLAGTTLPRYFRTSSGCSSTASDIEQKMTPTSASLSL